jgi:solute carrier family 25 protein 42
MVAGGFAGLVAQTVTYPMDVMRRRMQTYDGGAENKKLYTSVYAGVRQILREEVRTQALKSVRL